MDFLGVGSLRAGSVDTVSCLRRGPPVPVALCPGIQFGMPDRRAVGRSVLGGVPCLRRGEPLGKALMVTPVVVVLAVGVDQRLYLGERSRPVRIEEVLQCSVTALVFPWV